jgi:uncharacterized membrane protein
MPSQEKLFIYGMWWRIGYGFLRILLGLAVLKVVGTPLTDIVQRLLGHELIEDKNDLLYGFLMHALASHPVSITYFLAFYFIFWGIIDVVLSYQLIRHRLWAFPASIVLISLFILYEAARFSTTHSPILFFVITIDVAVLLLIWREYGKLKQRSGH